MSRRREIEIECPVCGGFQTVIALSSINVDVDPSLREKLFDSEINIFSCVSCQNEALLDVPLLYNDMTRQFCVQYFPEDMLSDVTNFPGFTSDGIMEIQSDLVGGHIGGYLSQPHVVFDRIEMIRYIVFRELLFTRLKPKT